MPEFKGIQSVRRLQQADPHALYALREHARDAGYVLDARTLSTLKKHGLATDRGVTDAVRALVAAKVTGFGLAMRVGRELAPAAGVSTRVLTQRAAQVKSVHDMVRWTAEAATLVDAHGKATPALQKLLLNVEPLFAKLSGRARMVFTDLAAHTGASLSDNTAMPMRRVPYWQKEVHPLANYQSSKSLPKQADVVIVGAGLTGGSAALHIADEAKKRGLRVVMIDGGEVAGQASGRNGGNLEAIPENFFGAYGTYDGFAEERYKFLKASYPHLPEKVLRKQAQRIAETIIQFGYKNAKLTTDDIAKHKLDVDHSLAGWLRLALNPREEKALREEVKLGEKLGLDVKLVSPAQIKKRWKLDTKFYGRVVENNGNFHPFKLVVQEVQRALDKGVQLYTNTKVTKIEDHVVTTERGAIRAGKVIVATNAFTSELFPQLKDIEYFRSQIVNYAHVENRLNGITFTAKDGDIYGNYPKQDWYTDRTGKKRGTLHLGGGQDSRAQGPAHARPTSRVYKLIQHEAKQLLPQLEGKVPVRTWAGPMAFVEGKHGMRMPVIGEIERDVLVAVWCNGYGSTGCHKTGAEAARWALEGAMSADVPKDVFGIERLLSDEPMFDA